MEEEEESLAWQQHRERQRRPYVPYVATQTQPSGRLFKLAADQGDVGGQVRVGAFNSGGRSGRSDVLRTKLPGPVSTRR